ncbi:hypothetical protein LOTGIDRAFT_179045 [Lottia gigantea]|uniref:Phosphatidylinositol-4,5-bisphosphate 3-kinase n=1 Tax=Lottia gigantea TaxID=225164 RepID=V3ZCI6_LOTGI|nr:hypothetical protein LOTGIDRAFT_179045 [Lottia gigantea]ESO88783.1 hypothetical protein LOTGIDRAFT_179045 [Lottia gigantea]
MPPLATPDMQSLLNPDGCILIDFLLPTGIIVPLSVNFYEPLEQIKKELWLKASKLPLYSLLNSTCCYCFVCVNQLGVKEELIDESQCLNDIRPFYSTIPFLKLVEKQGDENNKTLLRNINSLVGKGPQKLEAWSTAEVTEFSTKMQQHCDRILQNRKSRGWVENLRIKHPQRLRPSWELPPRLQGHLSNDCIVVEIRNEMTQATYTVKQPAMGHPVDLITVALRKWANTSGRNPEDPDHYVLKPYGYEDYIYGDYPLQQFKYVYSCLIKNKAPQFWLLKRDDIVGEVKLFVGLYHGSESLCEVCNTGEVQINNGSCNVTIDLKFDINVSDLPSASRICFALYSLGNIEMLPAAWVNIPVYDFRSRLIRGERTMDMWTVEDNLGFDEICHVLGTIAPNPYGHDSPSLSVLFPDYNIRPNIIYPSYDKVISFFWKKTHSHYELQMIINKDPLSPLFEQEKELLWLLRYECLEKYPHALSKLLSSIKWCNHIDVAKMTALLQAWQCLPVDYALELLDFNFPDKNVREFAIKSLDEKLCDDEMSQYLLQLVQAVKYEIYLNCPLVKFLLSRAVQNQHIGQQLFWHLKSEMHDPRVMVRFRLIIEVYLRSSKDHLLVLLKQSEALGKLKGVNEIVKSSSFNLQDAKQNKKAKDHMKKILDQKSFKECLSNLCSPLSSIYKLKELLTEKCNIFNSKKRPLHIVWSNDDIYGSDINLIFKNGDDLRQDMLTLQMFQIMDNIWQFEGLDLRMNPYGCLATGHEQGMIEVVTMSKTVANIQKWYNKNAFNRKALFEWLKCFHPTKESLEGAVEEFILSCAGYCVATYVLGIGDRHNDNIMLKESGQLFHIDFGHFLGNFKSKFGVRRDRVPFVLTTHFVYVITNGDTKLENFKRFKEYCESAYLILRRKGHLFFSLFMMMLSSGLPQLTCTRDVEYLRETLKPDLSEEEALNHFRLKFQDAIKNSWTTTLNFFIHIKAKDNT